MSSLRQIKYADQIILCGDPKQGAAEKTTWFALVLLLSHKIKC